MNTLSSAIPAHLMRQTDTMTEAKNIMGKDDFLKLLMAQLKQQDPLNPLKHEEFASQLAQFSSLEKLSGINSGIEGLKQSMGSDDKLQVLGMIGKVIEANGKKVSLIEGHDVSLKLADHSGIQPIKADVYNAKGEKVREIDLARANFKNSEIKWDGKDHDGISLSSGEYTFRVHGVDSNGQARELSTELSGKVVGVDVGGKEPVLVVETTSGKARVSLSKVSKVSLEEGAKTAPSSQKVPNATVEKSIAVGVPKISNNTESTGESSKWAPRGFPNASLVGRFGK